MKRFLLFILALTLSLPLAASDFVTFDQIIVSSSAIGIGNSITNPPGRPEQTVCTARLEEAQARYRTDGTDPTASVGVLLDVGDWIRIESNADARRIKFIRTGATDAKVSVECYR